LLPSRRHFWLVPVMGAVHSLQARLTGDR
jgi:hypothetical protein